MPVDLEYSDMKGVSSLLRMKEEWKKAVIENDSDEEKNKAEGLGFVLRGIDMNEGNNGSSTSDVKDPNMEKSIDGKPEEIGGDEYSIGDFVWGKITSHPWWPGQIHDPSNASDHALKLKQEGKFLVAYFGDGSFAWCSSSQLRPFGDQFNEMVKQSSSRIFVKAVEAAVAEMGRFIISKMTCLCYKGPILNRPVVINSGLKENPCVPDLGIEKLLVHHQPLDLLTILKTKAQTPHNPSNLLQISTMKNWVLAFYRSKGVYHFAKYSRPKVIEGLEDPEKVAEENSVMGRNQTRGPVEEDECLKSCSSGNGRMPKRKQKSIAEILEIKEEARKVANHLVEPISKMGDTKKRKDRVKDDAEDSGLKGFASREREKSKYLPSPYKNPTNREGKGDEKKQRSADPKDKNNTSAKDVLSEIQTLGADPDFLKKTESFSLFEGFLRDFRISVNSANDSLEQKQKTRGRKAKNNGTTDSESRKTMRIKKNDGDDDLDIDTPIINLIGSRKKKEKDDLGARLLVSFTPNSSLPSKEDLTNIYSRFGPLNDADTRMYDTNFCGIVSFERTADAESALMSSKNSNPFGSAYASFVLRRLKTPKKNPAAEEEKKVPEMEFLKRKLEDMSSLLEKSDGRLSKKVRSKMERELKVVLEKVASTSGEGW